MENKNILAANTAQNTQNTGVTPPPAAAPQAQADGGVQPQVTAQPQAAAGSSTPSVPPTVPATPAVPIAASEPIGNALNGGGKLAFLKNKRFQMWLSIIGIAVVIAGTASVMITRQSGLYRATLDQDSGSLTEKFQGNIFRVGEDGAREGCDGVQIKITNWDSANKNTLIDKIVELYRLVIETTITPRVSVNIKNTNKFIGNFLIKNAFAIGLYDLEVSVQNRMGNSFPTSANEATDMFTDKGKGDQSKLQKGGLPRDNTGFKSAENNTPQCIQNIDCPIGIKGELSQTCISGSCVMRSSKNGACDADDSHDCQTGLVCRNQLCVRNVTLPAPTDRDRDRSADAQDKCPHDPAAECECDADDDCADGLTCNNDSKTCVADDDTENSDVTVEVYITDFRAYLLAKLTDPLTDPEEGLLINFEGNEENDLLPLRALSGSEAEAIVQGLKDFASAPDSTHPNLGVELVIPEGCTQCTADADCADLGDGLRCKNINVEGEAQKGICIMPDPECPVIKYSIDAINRSRIPEPIYSRLYDPINEEFNKLKCIEEITAKIPGAPAANRCETFNKVLNAIYKGNLDRDAFSDIQEDLQELDGYTTCELTGVQVDTLPEQEDSESCQFAKIAFGLYPATLLPETAVEFSPIYDELLAFAEANTCLNFPEWSVETVPVVDQDAEQVCNVSKLAFELLRQSNLQGDIQTRVRDYFVALNGDTECAGLGTLVIPELPSEAGALKRAQCEGIKRAGELLKKSGISAEQYAVLIVPYRTQATELACPAELTPAETLTNGDSASIFNKLFALVDNAYAAAGDACNVNYYLLLGLLNESTFLEAEYNSKYDLLQQMAGDCAFPAKPANKDCLPAERTALEEKLSVLNENTNNLEEAALQEAFARLQEEFHSFGCKSPLAEALNPVERAPEEPETPEEQCEAIIDAVREISAETVEEYNEAYAEQVIKVAELVRAGSQCEVPEPTPPDVTSRQVNTGASECTAQELQDVTSLFNMLTQGPTVGSVYMQVYNQLKAQAQSQGCGDKVPAVPVGRDQEPAPDTDKDGIPDSQDACKDKAGVASADLKKNGCPAEAANLYDLVATTPRSGQTGTTTGTGAMGQVQPVQPSQPYRNQTTTGATGNQVTGTQTGSTVRTTGQAQVPAGNTTPNLGNTYRYSPVTSYGQQIGGGTGPGMLAYLFIPLGANALWFIRRKLKK